MVSKLFSTLLLLVLIGCQNSNLKPGFATGVGPDLNAPASEPAPPAIEDLNSIAELPSFNECPGPFYGASIKGIPQMVTPDCQVDPTPEWLCRRHTAQAGLNGRVRLVGDISKGVTIHLRGGSDHCANGGIALSLLSSGFGGKRALVCDTSWGPCYAGTFLLNVGEKPQWKIPASYFRQFVQFDEDGNPKPAQYILEYDWQHTPLGGASTCSRGRDQRPGGFGIGIYVASDNRNAPDPIYCQGITQ